MQESGAKTGEDSEESGIVADPVETKSARKQPSGAANTDSNPDKV